MESHPHIRYSSDNRSHICRAFHSPKGWKWYQNRNCQPPDCGMGSKLSNQRDHSVPTSSRGKRRNVRCCPGRSRNESANNFTSFSYTSTSVGHREASLSEWLSLVFIGKYLPCLIVGCHPLRLDQSGGCCATVAERFPNLSGFSAHPHNADSKQCWPGGVPND